ncbi:MAG: endonuclease/exonuclease/phosphatase family protein [Oscillibacter sp.]|nr:endonuclease/exonuclease/phosphatase family protein [Oscillibacter sp.]MBQ9617670.1 endonuclease/exonuclease/phosphatase family protein [Oscillibacter sp.]
MNKKRWWRIPLVIVVALLCVVGVYVGYVVLSYSRIPDLQALSVAGDAAQIAQTGTEYTAVSYNVGFGAYTPEFTFFMDGGKDSWAASEESVVACIEGSAETALSFDPDLVLFQEVDTDSTRSHHVDEAAIINSAFPGFDSVAAVNYHSAFLMYPLTQPHGASNSCLLTESAFDISSAIRRSLPISTGFKKFLDLDRCYSVARIPVENGKELVVINAHLSAYGTDASQGEAQLEMLFADMAAEYEQGNYVLCGGDFNHDFPGDSREILNPGTDRVYSWCQPLPAELLPDGLSICTDYAEGVVASTRDTDIPYGPDSFTVILDGFIVSDNVQCAYTQVVDTGFLYSDHNPVILRFTLL